MKDLPQALIICTLMICMTFGFAQCQRADNEYHIAKEKLKQSYK